MKKIIVLFSFIILLTGCSKNVDLSDYLDLEYNQPVLNKDLTIEEPSMRIAIDRESLLNDYPQINLDETDDVVLKNLGVLVNGESLDTLNLDGSSFEITINTKLEDGTKIIANKTITEDDEEVQARRNDYEQQLMEIEKQKQNLQNIAAYVEAAEDNLLQFSSANIDFYVSASKFSDAHDFFEMKTPLFECDKKMQKYLDDNSIYYIAKKVNNDQTYYSLFDDSFNQTDIVLFNGILLTNYAYTTAGGSSKVVEAPVEVPMIYVNDLSSQNNDILYNTETKSKFTSSEKMTRVIEDYETVFKPTVELKSDDPGYVEQRLMNYIDVEYIFSNGNGYSSTQTLDTNPNLVEVGKWAEALLAPQEITSYSYSTFSAQTYGVFNNHYNVSVKLANGFFD